jgi:hypothetical protein
MKKIFFVFLVLFSSFIYSQTSGMTYQAVILNLEGQIPGYNNERAPLANKLICLRFKIITGSSQNTKKILPLQQMNLEWSM